MAETTLVISDLHCPFQHPDAFKFLDAVRARTKPTQIVCIGDEVDMHAVSDYDHNPDGLAPGDELKAAIKELKQLYAIFPVVKSCVSNHTARPFRRAEKFGIPRAFLRSYAEFLEAPKGWEWADKWEIDRVRYEHGEGVSGKLGHLRAAEQNMQNTVIGHIHSHAGIAFNANPKYLIFGMNVGWLGDKDAYAFSYGKAMRTKPVLSVGVVRDQIPTLIPMQLKKGGRWTGAL